MRDDFRHPYAVFMRATFAHLHVMPFAAMLKRSHSDRSGAFWLLRFFRRLRLPVDPSG